jgi:hypothetical protein
MHCSFAIRRSHKPKYHSLKVERGFGEITFLSQNIENFFHGIDLKVKDNGISVSDVRTCRIFCRSTLKLYFHLASATNLPQILPLWSDAVEEMLHSTSKPYDFLKQGVGKEVEITMSNNEPYLTTDRVLWTTRHSLLSKSGRPVMGDTLKPFSISWNLVTWKGISKSV